MILGPLVPLLILCAIVGGIAVWVRRSRPSATTRSVPTTDGQPSAPRRVSLLMEAVGYIGTILVVAGASTAVGQRWSDIGTPGRLAILGVATIVFLGIGLAIRSSAEPAFQRLTGVVWAVSVAAFAGSAGVVCAANDTAGETAFFAIASTSTAYALLLWWFHDHAIQHAVLFGGVMLTTASFVVRAVSEPDAWMVALPLWAIALAWAAAGWWRLIAPWFVAVPLGLLVALIAPSAIAEISGLRFGIGIATAGVVMGLSVAAAFTPGLAMAAVAMLGYVIGAVVYYFGDQLGVPASLAIAGLVVLAFAAAAARWHWFSRQQPPANTPPSAGGDTPQPSTRMSGRHHPAA